MSRQTVILGIAADPQSVRRRPQTPETLRIARNDADSYKGIEDAFQKNVSADSGGRNGRKTTVCHQNVHSARPAVTDKIRPQFGLRKHKDVRTHGVNRPADGAGDIEGIVDEGIGGGNDPAGHFLTRVRGRGKDNTARAAAPGPQQ